MSIVVVRIQVFGGLRVPFFYYMGHLTFDLFLRLDVVSLALEDF